MEPVQIVVVHRDVHPVTARADARPARKRQPRPVAAGDGERELVGCVVGDQEARIRLEHVDVAGEQGDEPRIDHVVGPDRQIRPGADVDAVEGAVAVVPDPERLPPVRGEQPFSEELAGRGEPSIFVEVGTQPRVHDVVHEPLAAAGSLSVDGVVQWAGEILRGADGVEVVVPGVEDGQVLDHLKEPERQDDRPVAALLGDEPPRDVPRVTDATQRDPAGVKAPVLRGGGRARGSDEQTRRDDPSERPCENVSQW